MRNRVSMLAIAALAACNSTSPQPAATAAAESLSTSTQPAPAAAVPVAPGKSSDVFVQNTAAAPVITRALDSSTDSVAIAQADGASWKVSVASLPPVSIDPTANTVRLPSTALVADETKSAGGANSPVSFGPYDVSAFSKVRISFHNVPPSDSSFILQGFLVDPGGYLLFSDLNQAGKGEGTMVLDLPGPAIQIVLWQFVSGSTVRVLVYGSNR